MTEKARPVRSGVGTSACAGDFDNDGDTDLFISGYDRNSLPQQRRQHLGDVPKVGRGEENRTRWGAGAAFLDYDRDGHLDLFVASYIDFDPKPRPTQNRPYLYKGVMVACGPPGTRRRSQMLYRNNGDSTFTDVSEKSGVTRANGTYDSASSSLISTTTADIYVANDSSPAALYQNNKNGTFTDIGLEAGAAFSVDGKPQAGMGISAGDYDRDGWLDIFKTNFSGDTRRFTATPASRFSTT